MTSVANHILHVVQSQSTRDIAMVTGYVLLARAIDIDGRMSFHLLTPRGQLRAETDDLIADRDRCAIQD